jgi:hypothetical protein
MTNEQLRMQMLAGIITESQYKAKLQEIKVNKPGVYYNSFFQAHLDQEEENADSDPDAGEIIDSFRNKNITSLDELVKNIEDLESELAESAEAGSYDYIDELVERLKDLIIEMHLPHTFQKELFDKLRIKYKEYANSMDWGDEYEDPFK